MRCEYTLTWELYRTWVKRDQLRGKKLVINLLLLVFGTVNLILAFPVNLITATQVGLFIACVYVVFFNWSFNARNQYRRAAKSCGGENWRRVITFGESSVVFSDGPSRRELKYADLTAIRELPDQVTLLFGKRASLIFPPNSFTQGSWPACRTLLRQKSHLK